MKSNLIKTSLSLSIIVSSLLLFGCNDNKENEVPTQEKVWEEVGVIDNDLFDKNEEKFFEIAFEMNQLITSTNSFVMFYESQLQNNNDIKNLMGLKPLIKQDVNSFYQRLENVKKLIDELEYSVDNKTHDKSLENIIADLKDGVSEYEFSLNYYDSFLVDAFEFKTLEEKNKNWEDYLKNQEEYRIVIRGHIEKMQNILEIASQKFVIEIGLFKKDYDVEMYSLHLDKYFEERLDKLEMNKKENNNK